MAKKNLNPIDKQVELKKYRDLVLATIDYHVENKEYQIKTSAFDSVEYFKGLKIQTEEHFTKGRLARLKQWFRDLTEMQGETKDLKFNNYLKYKTKYDIDIFKSYNQRVDRIIEKGRITSDSQFYDISIMVDQLCQSEPIDNGKIEKLNRLLSDYEERKSRKIKKPIDK